MAEWRKKCLGEITSFMSKGIPPKYVERENENTVRVLNQKCNRNFEINYEESRLHDCSKKKVPADKMLQPGDVLINSTGTGTAGRVAQLYDVPKPTTIDGHMILLRPTEEIASIYYGYAVKAFQPKIETLAEGSTGQTEINRKRLQEEIVISFPKEKETQERIARFLLNIDKKIKVNDKIKEEFSDTCFYISGEDKEIILKELDLYNINEATLFPELEHQLSYIKYANRNLVNPVTDFTKYEEESASNKQDIGVKQPELEQYILDNFYDQFKGIIGEEDVEEVLNIIKEHFTVDWYKRNPILSKINMSITGYYFKKCQSRDAAKQKAEQIVTLLNQMVEDFITATDERGE